MKKMKKIETKFFYLAIGLIAVAGLVCVLSIVFNVYRMYKPLDDVSKSFDNIDESMQGIENSLKSLEEGREKSRKFEKRLESFERDLGLVGE